MDGSLRGDRLFKNFKDDNMLTYLINVTSEMLFFSIVIAAIAAFVDGFCEDRGWYIYRIGLFVGFIAAAIRTYITNTQRLVAGYRVGMYGYYIALLMLIIMYIVMIIFGKKVIKNRALGNKVSIPEYVISAICGLLGASYIYISLPNVMIYPFKFDTGGNGILSSDYLFRLGGYLLGLIVCFTSYCAAYNIISFARKKSFNKLVAFSLVLLNLMYGVNVFARLMLVLTPRKIIDSVKLFIFGAESNNHSHWYTYSAFIIILLIGIVLLIRSISVKEAYTTNAMHRKQKAFWRSVRRNTFVTVICFIVGILCSTWFVKLNTVVIREAPVEDPLIIKDASGVDSELRVPLEMVKDGHLHRFGYETPEGHLVRFIVVLKQEGTSNYGIGLDACEICGEAGYYENQDGQIVCKKCSVIMNKTTIGMKGGCNPIIIDYDMNESYITVPVSEMILHQSKFSK